MGRAFHKVGAACAKLRFPNITVRVFGTTSDNESCYLKVLLGIHFKHVLDIIRRLYVQYLVGERHSFFNVLCMSKVTNEVPSKPE